MEEIFRFSNFNNLTFDRSGLSYKIKKDSPGGALSQRLDPSWQWDIVTLFFSLSTFLLHDQGTVCSGSIVKCLWCSGWRLKHFSVQSEKHYPRKPCHCYAYNLNNKCIWCLVSPPPLVFIRASVSLFVHSLVQPLSPCIYLKRLGFFFFHIPIPLYSMIVNIKQIYTDWLQVY